MKKYNQILSFGCSYTFGGGLNNRNFHRYLKGDSYVSEEPEGVLPEHIMYARDNAYPARLARLLDCDFINYGESRASNEFIFNLAYENIKNIKDPEHTLVTIQTSHLNRILLQLVDKKMQYNVNNFSILLDDEIVRENIKEYYKLFIKNFFDEEYEYKKVLQNIEMMSAYSKHRNVDILFLIYEKPSSYKNTDPNPYIVDFETKDLREFANVNSIRIEDLPNIKWKDTHFSPDGHELIASKIHNYLNKVYNL